MPGVGKNKSYPKGMPAPKKKPQKPVGMKRTTKAKR